MALDGTGNAQPPPPSPGVSSETQQQAPRRRKRRRWGDAATAATATTGTTTSKQSDEGAPPPATGMNANPNLVVADPKTKLRAMQESIQARLQAAKAASSSQVVSSADEKAGGSTSAVPERVAALQQSIQARLQAAKAKQQQLVKQVLPNAVSVGTNSESQRPSKRAKHYELDLSVTGPTFAKTQSTASAAPVASPSSATGTQVEASSKGQQPKNPYLAHSMQEQQQQGDEGDDYVLDGRLANRQPRSRKHRELKFVEPGKWQEIAQRRREKALKAQESGFLSGRKTGHTIQANTLGEDIGAGASIYGPAAEARTESGLVLAQDEVLPPRWDSHPDTTMPLVLEWWDAELLPSRLRKQIGKVEAVSLNQQAKAALLHNLKQPPVEEEDGNDSKKPPAAPNENASLSTDERSQLYTSCWEQAALFHCKTADLVQHIVPIPSPAAQTEAPQPVLHLTRKELKRQRKLRRQEKQRELQDLQAAGLIAAPEPRLTLQNFIRVLGDQAFLDPSKYEQKVVAQIQARQAAHEQRNQERKLTKEQRSAKATTKLQTQADKAAQSGQIHVALFYVKNMSHPYHRTKVDLNAQQLLITGGVLECPTASCVIVEGSPQAIKKFIRLMTERMSWTSGPDSTEPDGDDHLEGSGDDEKDTVVQKFDLTNRCELVWQGMVVKRCFPHFSFQSTETPEQCRKILRQKGLAHYWDQVMDVALRAAQKSVTLRLASSIAVEPGTSSDD